MLEQIRDDDWQKYTVRGFVGILGSKGGEKIGCVKNADGGTRIPRRE